MKCLEKNRGRRYETASGLAADVERHLEHEPVVARPPSAVLPCGEVRSAEQADGRRQHNSSSGTGARHFGQHLAGVDQTIRVWDASDWAAREPLRGHTGEVHGAWRRSGEADEDDLADVLRQRGVRQPPFGHGIDQPGVTAHQLLEGLFRSAFPKPS
jgi:hypothetical protein